MPHRFQRALASVLLSAALFAQQPGTPTFDSNPRLVLVPFQVERGKYFAADLQPSDFILREDGHPRQFTTFEGPNTAHPLPLELILLFDTTPRVVVSKDGFPSSPWALDPKADYEFLDNWDEAITREVLQRNGMAANVFPGYTSSHIPGRCPASTVTDFRRLFASAPQGVVMLNPASPTSASCLDPTPQNLCFPPRRGDYLYFQPPAQHPGDPTMVSLSRAADASMLAYARFVQQRMVLADLQGILAAAGYPNVQPIGDCFVDNANTGRGYFAYNDNQALLAFRGTETDNNNDKAADAEIDRTPEAGALVHSGFKRYLDSVRGQDTQCVRDYRANHPNQNICITGHSLGAALATLAFTRLNDPASSLITFGCPRVGNPAYCNVIAAAARTRACYRVVDNLDIVTHAPPDFLNLYAHPPVAVYWLAPDHTLRINPPGLPSDRDAIAQLPDGFLTTHWMDDLPDPLSEPLADHSPVRYAQYIGMA